MAEELLDRTQVGAALEEVRGERVPEAMRVGERAAERRRIQPPAAGREEQRVLRAARELRARVAEVAGEPVRRLLAERHRPLLAALAADVHLLLLEVDVGEIQADGLGAAEAGGVDELDERAVPDGDRPVVAERAGFVREGIERSARFSPRQGRRVDFIVYSRLPDD